MDDKDRLINDLAVENTQLRINEKMLKYEIERLTAKIAELEQTEKRD